MKVYKFSCSDAYGDCVLSGLVYWEKRVRLQLNDTYEGFALCTASNNFFFNRRLFELLHGVRVTDYTVQELACGKTVKQERLTLSIADMYSELTKRDVFRWPAHELERRLNVVFHGRPMKLKQETCR